MHSKDINDNKYFMNILENIHNHLPQFVSIWENEDIYPIAFEFGQFLLENKDNREIQDSGKEFINEAIDKGGDETEDLIVLQIFQQIYPDTNFSNVFKLGLSDKASKIFTKFYEEYKKDFY